MSEGKMKSKVAREMKALPKALCLKGKVVKGFQRGSKLLGWPTANLDPAAFKGKVDDLGEGVYFGFAKIASDEKIYETALSIGWNPQFQNKEKTVEAYLVNEFQEDFYGEEMRLMICGHVRPQVSFDSLESLKEAISGDVDATVQILKEEKYTELKDSGFWTA
mmetsp:Transcript_14676/g.20545  ORF Transcript_14676/g.20545 Transcript_14676/m.20545 type:complete len:163 (-) Transcript_14676:125-613(-)